MGYFLTSYTYTQYSDYASPNTYVPVTITNNNNPTISATASGSATSTNENNDDDENTSTSMNDNESTNSGKKKRSVDHFSEQRWFAKIRKEYNKRKINLRRQKQPKEISHHRKEKDARPSEKKVTERFRSFRNFLLKI